MLAIAEALMGLVVGMVASYLTWKPDRNTLNKQIYINSLKDEQIDELNEQIQIKDETIDVQKKTIEALFRLLAS